MFQTLAVLPEMITIKLPWTHTLVTPEKQGRGLNGQGRRLNEQGKTVILSTQGMGYSCHNKLQKLLSLPTLSHLTSGRVKKCVMPVELQANI